jgi:DNA-binding NarL/FixJ family response regulator
MYNDYTWTSELVAEHCKEAISTERMLPEVTVQGYRQSMPDVIHTIQELRLMEPRRTIRARATPDAISRWEQMLEWLTWLTIEERKIIRWRASGISCKNIGRALKCDQSTIWRQWRCGLAKISSRLNKRGVMLSREPLKRAA